MNKRGISPIVSTLLMIVLVIVGTSAVFVSVRELSQQTSSAPILQQCLTLNIRAENCIIDEENELISVRVSRGAGGGDISIIKILFNIPSGLKSQEEMVSLNPLDSKVFIYDLSEFSETEDVDVLGVIDGNLCRATGSPVKCVSGIIDDPEPPINPLNYCSDFDVVNSCDYRFAIQNAYSQYDLTIFGFANGNNDETKKIWIAGGGATISTQSTTEEEFLSSTPEEIKSAMLDYASRNGLDVNTKGIIMLDIEDPWKPKEIGLYNNDPGFQSEIISAFKRRIDVGREVFPYAQLTMYATINAPANGNPANNPTGSQGFLEQYKGHKIAAEQGMYDNLDFLSPQAYINWGPDDQKNWVNIENVKSVIEYTRTLKKRNGESFNQMILTQQIIGNIQSLNDGEPLPYDMMYEYIEAIQSYPYVTILGIWHGTDDLWPCNKGDPIPCSCGNPKGTQDPFNQNSPVSPNLCYPTDVISNFKNQKLVPCSCLS